MKMRWAGVALAAMLACVGLGTSARQAQAFSFAVDGGRYPDDFLTVIASGTENYGDLTVFKTYYPEPDEEYFTNLYAMTDAPIVKLNGDISYGNITITYNYYKDNFYRVGETGNPKYPSLEAPDYTKVVFDFGVINGVISPFGYVNTDYVSGPAEITYTGFPSLIPIPASAPMFGAALIGLAGLSYAAKRKKAAAAT